MKPVSYTTPIPAAQQHLLLASARNSVFQYTRYWNSKLHFTHFFSTQDVEDIVGNVVFRACRSFDKYVPSKSRLSTWIDRIARNCVKDWVDDRMSRFVISAEYVEQNHYSGSVYGDDEVCNPYKGFNPELKELLSEEEADKSLIFREFESEVRGSIARLSEKSQQFVKAIEEGDKPRDMARKFGCTANAAARRCYSIREALKRDITAIAAEFDVPFYSQAC